MKIHISFFDIYFGQALLSWVNGFTPMISMGLNLPGKSIHLDVLRQDKQKVHLLVGVVQRFPTFFSSLPTFDVTDPPLPTT